MKISKIRLFLWKLLVILLQGVHGGCSSVQFPSTAFSFRENEFSLKIWFRCENSKKCTFSDDFRKQKPNFVVDDIEFVFRFGPILHVCGIWAPSIKLTADHDLSSGLAIKQNPTKLRRVSCHSTLYVFF